MTTIALATSTHYADLTEDEQRLVTVLNTLGITARPAVWNDPDVLWQDFDAVIIRSIWDYHHHHNAFLAWITRLERQGVSLWNAPSVLRWNSHKRYLLDIAEWDIPTIATLYFSQGETADLTTLLRRHGWQEAVVKPAVSASAFNTSRITVPVPHAGQAQFDFLLAQGDVLVQPYLPEITDGEWSLIFFNSVFSHAVLKRPGAGDFRVQREFGGSSTVQQAPAPLIEQATSILRRLKDSPIKADLLYVRVDGVMRDNTFIVMELEAVEPSLFITDDEKAHRFATAIAARLEVKNEA